MWLASQLHFGTSMPSRGRPSHQVHKPSLDAQDQRCCVLCLPGSGSHDPHGILRVPAIHFGFASREFAMPTSVEEFATQAIRLSTEDRARLADPLLVSLPEAEDSEVDAAWDEEIRRRVNAVESGSARLVSAAEVHAQARKIFQR